jgi:hypothetical protein
MGPGNKGDAQDRSSLVSRKPEEAPQLYPGADRFRWCRQVSAWVSYIQRRADAGDKLCKSHAATLSDLLYAAAHPSYQKVLELAKSASLDFSVPTEKQPDVVHEIVRLIGFETPIEATSRLLAAYKAVHACIRYSNETLDKFTVRYRGVASNYMDLANVSCNSQDSQFLALVLLENAQLTPDNLQGAKLQLVHQAQQRVAHCSDQSEHRETQCIANCTQMLSSLETHLPDNVKESAEIVSDTVMVSRSIYMDVISCITEIKTVLSAKYLGHDQISASDRPHPIFLDDAVHVLQTMTGQVKARVSFQTQTESPAPIFLASNHSSLTPTSNRTSLQQMNHPDEGASMTSLKKRTICHAWNRYGHWKGDPSCAKKRQKANNGVIIQRQQQETQQKSNEGDTDKGF